MSYNYCFVATEYTVILNVCVTHVVVKYVQNFVRRLKNEHYYIYICLYEDVGICTSDVLSALLH